MSLKKLYNQKRKITESAEIIVCQMIERYCRRYKRTVKTVYGVTVIDKNGNQIMQDTIVEKWIFDFENKFGSFGFYVCERGKWINGQTPLIKFKKPALLKRLLI